MSCVAFLVQSHNYSNYQLQHRVSLLCVMEPPRKSHKASACISARRVSERALSTIIESIRDNGIPDATSRSTIRRKKKYRIIF